MVIYKKITICYHIHKQWVLYIPIWLYTTVPSEYIVALKSAADLAM